MMGPPPGSKRPADVRGGPMGPVAPGGPGSAAAAAAAAAAASKSASSKKKRRLISKRPQVNRHWWNRMAVSALRSGA